MTPVDGLWAVIPVKPFALAKSRLADALPTDARGLLAEAMFLDVLAAIRSSGGVAGVAVVTRCPVAAAHARAAGAVVIDGEPEGGGTNGAVVTALAALAGLPAVMIVQADLPLTRPGDIASVAVAHGRGAPPAVTLVPALDGGTNVMVQSPPGVVAPQFGPDSFSRHLGAARAAGIEPTVLRPESLVRDIDHGGDLALLAACAPHSLTRRLIGERPHLLQSRTAWRSDPTLSIARPSRDRVEEVTDDLAV